MLLADKSKSIKLCPRHPEPVFARTNAWLSQPVGRLRGCDLHASRSASAIGIVRAHGGCADPSLSAGRP
jgi:hypothetical protein